ncbi:MAG: amidohydrolase family protein, partial [Actinomycetota bacterium]
HPFMTNSVWKNVSHLPVGEQAAMLSRPEVRAELLRAQTDEKNPNVTGGLRIDHWNEMFELADPPNYEPDSSSSIAAISARTGRSEPEVALDIILSDGGRGMIYIPFSNYSNGTLDATREMLVDEFTLPGLSDGGAHVGTICDASFVSTLLQHWARDRDHGTIDLPLVIRWQTRDTARAVGLNDRGQIAPGLKADLNVIDMKALRLHRPQMRYDLPAGGRRLVQRVDGYRHTFVSGVETYRDGEQTGELPGRLVRGSTRR